MLTEVPSATTLLARNGRCAHRPAWQMRMIERRLRHTRAAFSPRAPISSHDCASRCEVEAGRTRRAARELAVVAISSAVAAGMEPSSRRHHNRSRRW